MTIKIAIRIALRSANHCVLVDGKERQSGIGVYRGEAKRISKAEPP